MEGDVRDTGAEGAVHGAGVHLWDLCLRRAGRVGGGVVEVSVIFFLSFFPSFPFLSRCVLSGMGGCLSDLVFLFSEKNGRANVYR